MKSFLFLILISISASASHVNGDPAYNWNDIVTEQPVELRQKIVINFDPAMGCKYSQLAMYPGTHLNVRKIVALDQIKVTMFELQGKKCYCPKTKSEMSIIDPLNPDNEPTSGHAVGVLMEKKCRMQVFVENRDLLQTSIFKNVFDN